MLKKISFSEQEVDEALERVSLIMRNVHPKSGGAAIGFMSAGPTGFVRMRHFGNPDDWAARFDDLTQRKLRLALSKGISTRGMLQSDRRLLPEESSLHPGGIPFGDLAVACSGLGDGNEPVANMLALELKLF